MFYRKSSLINIMIYAIGLAWACMGCNGDPQSPLSKRELYFPEIENMTLVVVDSAAREGAEIAKNAYFIDRFEVTNRAFQQFIHDSGYAPHDPNVYLEHWNRPSDNTLTPLHHDLDLPVVFVNIRDAMAFARHYGKYLPTKEQWLWSAIGWVGKKSFPWGDQFMNFYCNSWRSGIHGLSKVGTFEYGKSEWGCYDLVGNAVEWCSTQAADQMEESYYILGGSWSQGGTPQEEENVFNLSSQMETVEAASRNNTLGFRCVRNDALAYIRDTLVPRVAALSWEERLKAMDELSEMTEPLYAMLKLLQFEAAVTHPLSARPSLSLAGLNEDPDGGEIGFLFCHDDGLIRSCTLDGRDLWRHKEEDKDAPYRFKTLSRNLEPSNRVISYSWLNSLLAVFDAGSGQELWRTGRGKGLAQHVVPVRRRSGQADAGELLLVVWYADDRYEVTGGEIKTFLDEIYTRIKDYARLLLTREAWNSPVREKHLSFFCMAPEVSNIEMGSQFDMDRFDDVELYFDGALDRRFKIQLLDGRYFNTEVRKTPACWLTLYDLDTGAVHWSLDFPGALFDFRGVVHRDPLVFDSNQRVAVVLEEDDREPGEAEEVRLCILDFSTGEIEFQTVFEGWDSSLTSLAVLGEDARCLVGIVGFQDLMIIDGNETDRWHVQRKTLPELLDAAEESLLISRNGEAVPMESLSSVLAWYSSPESLPEQGESFLQPIPPALHDLWVLGPTQPPWLVTEPDLNENRLLFTCHGEESFRKVYILKGAYNRYVYLSGGDDEGRASYVLIWDSSGKLLCFDAATSRYLWMRELGSISELVKPVMTDLNRDGAFEAAIPILSGEIKIIELDTGKNISNMMRAGASFTFLVPVEADGDAYQEMLVGIKDRGVYLLNEAAEAADEENVDLRLAIAALEQWMALKKER